jgi:hypothetical protein
MGPIHALRPGERTTTIAPGLTRSKRSMTSSLVMRMQPDDMAWPIYSGWLVPWMRYRIGRTSGNPRRVRAEPRLNLRRRDTVGPFSHAANRSDAGERQRFLPHRHAVADRLALGQDVIEITRVGIDQDRARRLFARIVDDMPAIGLWNGCLRIRRMGQQLPVPWDKTSIRRPGERRLHAAAEREPEQPHEQQREPGLSRGEGELFTMPKPRAVRLLSVYLAVKPVGEPDAGDRHGSMSVAPCKRVEVSRPR